MTTPNTALHHRGFTHEQLDLSLAYRVGSSVLHRLPLYARIRSYSSTTGDGEEKPTIGVRTPPPGYYDVNALEEAGLERGGVSAGSGSISVVSTETDDGQSGGAGSVNTGYFPDTGTKRFLQSFGSLLRTLGNEAPALDSSWSPGRISPVLADEGASDQEANHHTAAILNTGHSECNCFNCFQQRQMYLLWVQSQPHSSTLCTSCQRPSPRPRKPLLHRLTAALVLQIFTVALVLYPYVKTVAVAGYAWERRNRVAERVLAVVLVLCERVGVVLGWVFGGGGDGGVDEQRVREWGVRVGGEVLGGVVDGLQMGVGVWGGKGKGKVEVVGVGL